MATGNNPYGMVPIGQAGTGQAFILPDETPNPLEVIEANQQRRYQREQQQLQQRKQDMKVLDDTIGTAWERDEAYLQPKRQALLEVVAHKYRNNQDPFDPRDPDFYDIRTGRSNVKDETALSNSQKKEYTLAEKEYLQEPNKYDEGSWEMIQLWSQLPPQERLNTPMPVLQAKNTFNAPKWINEFAKNIKGDVEASYGVDVSKGQAFDKTETVYPVEKLANAGLQLYASSPDMTDFVDTYFDNTLNQEQRDALTSKANEVNRELKKQGSTARVTPKSMLAQDMLETQLEKKETINTHNLNKDWYDGDGSGSKEDEQDFQYLLQTLAGLRLGNPDMYDSFFGTKNGPAQMANAFPKAKIGEDKRGNAITVEAWRLIGDDLYIKDSESAVKNAKTSNGFRKVNDLYNEFIEPYARNNWGTDYQKKLNLLAKYAKEKYGINLKGGSLKYEDFIKIWPEGANSQKEKITW